VALSRRPQQARRWGLCPLFLRPLSEPLAQRGELFAPLDPLLHLGWPGDGRGRRGHAEQIQDGRLRAGPPLQLLSHPPDREGPILLPHIAEHIGALLERRVIGVPDGRAVEILVLDEEVDGGADGWAQFAAERLQGRGAIRVAGKIVRKCPLTAQCLVTSDERRWFLRYAVRGDLSEKQGL
jgi:hypothetical protein